VIGGSWHRRFLLGSSSGLRQLGDFFANTCKLHCVLPGRLGANDNSRFFFFLKPFKKDFSITQKDFKKIEGKKNINYRGNFFN
jgi:hypothetical protein